MWQQNKYQKKANLRKISLKIYTENKKKIESVSSKVYPAKTCLCESENESVEIINTRTKHHTCSDFILERKKSRQRRSMPRRFTGLYPSKMAVSSFFSESGSLMSYWFSRSIKVKVHQWTKHTVTFILQVKVFIWTEYSNR